MAARSMGPKVSVIIPTYNRPQLIKRTVGSALEQTYKNIEIIVVDGDPTGATAKVLAPFVKAHPGVVRDFRFEQLPRTGTVYDRANIARNRNAGIRIAEGKYIAPLDDDDDWPDNEKLAKQVAFMEAHPEYTLTAGGLMGVIKHPGGTVTKEAILFAERDEDIRKMILMLFGIMNSTVMYKKCDWERVGGYDEIHPVSETQDFHLKLGKIGKLCNFQDYFVRYVFGEHERDHIVKYGRYCLYDGFRIIWTYRKDYPGVYKAFAVQALYYAYTFVPLGIKNVLRSFSAKIQVAFFRKFGGTNAKREKMS